VKSNLTSLANVPLLSVWTVEENDMARLTYFSSGRTSLWRGALALVLAPAFVLLLSLTGGFIAWAFWWIARDFPERSPPK
jgi:hypothetical protein